MAGTVGGWAQVMAAQPFDTVKVRLQCQSRTNPTYTGTMDCVRKTAAEGLSTFYKGTVSPLIGVGFMVSIQFGVLEAAKRALVARHKAAGQSTELSVSEVAACGSLAGMSAGTVSSPVEHVRIRMQLQGSGPSPPGATAGAAVSTPPGARAFSAAAGPAYNGSIDAFRQIFKTYGFRGLYQGTSATMWREIIGYAGYFGAYEIVKRRFAAAQGEENLHVGHYLAAGSAAGFGMWIPAYPLDVIKSKMQADALTGQRKYPNIWRSAQVILAEEGVAGLFRGMAPCMARAAPANGVTFVAYELGMKWLNQFD
ncbi:unnamed protein product [Symbiodinium sp. KB8]|nr:unnamed protein product [Symbiodinium sp. KB8]